MNRITKVLNVFGLSVAAIYLLGGLLTAPKFGVTTRDKDEALAQIEKTATGKDASIVARPFLSLMMNVIASAKISLLLSCGVVLVNGCIFFVNIVASRQRTSETNPDAVPHKRREGRRGKGEGSPDS